MKSLLKKIFLLSSVFIIPINAQETASATATGSFSVLGYTTVTRLADLMFGDLVLGDNTTVQPTSPKAAQFLFNGSPNTRVQISITYPRDLTCGSNTLRFHSTSAVFNTISNPTTATPFLEATGGEATTGNDGNLYIWVGGRVMAKKKQPVGSYNGLMKIIVVQP